MNEIRGQASAGEQRFIALENLVADTVRNCIMRDGKLIAVEPRVMELFAYLAAVPGQIISKRELMERVWRANVVDEAIHRAVSILRAVLGDSARNSLILETVPRHGYRLLVRPDALRTGNGPLPRRGTFFSAPAAWALFLTFLVSAAYLSDPFSARPSAQLSSSTGSSVSARAPASLAPTEAGTTAPRAPDHAGPRGRAPARPDAKAVPQHLPLPSRAAAPDALAATPEAAPSFTPAAPVAVYEAPANAGPTPAPWGMRDRK